ncbi:MAG TPA: ATP-dependent helicase HrpB [Polyangiaceae bacterium]
MQALPIDVVLPEIVEALQSGAPLVLEAPPGAGKTTRVPWAIHEAFMGGEVIVAEPRRLAARLTAARVASERGERLGETVGYSVRFEEVGGPRTRIRYVTEGVLLRRLLADPELRGVTQVVLDEFHERSLLSDLLLLLLQRLRLQRRPELGLSLMSATLDAGPVAELLGARRVRSEGRMFPLTIEHLPALDERPLDKQVVSAVRSATARDAGDVLVFLPGSAEIRRALSALEPLAAEQQLLLLPLHGDLPIAEQARAVEPAARRKVVLSTNVAETSVTIDGVTTVIDSGLARLASHSPWSGLPTLTTTKISRAAAIQRAGRAGRTRAGLVLRLYTKGDFDSRREHELPEVARADLSEALLALAGAGITRPRELGWLTAPPEAALTHAEELLRWLSAVTPAGDISPHGRRLLQLPLHPRLARIVTRGEELGVGAEACLAAALLSERDIRSDARLQLGAGRRSELGVSGPCDVLELMSRFAEAEAVNFRPDGVRRAGLDVRTVQSVETTRRKLAGRRDADRRAPRPEAPEAIDAATRRAILSGFPDRVGKRRRPGQPDVVFAEGGSAKLGESSVVHEGELLVAVAADERSSGGGRAQVAIRLATAIEADWLLDDFGEHVRLRDELSWNADSERVERSEGMAYGAVLLDETRGVAPASAEASRLLFEAARSRGLFTSLASSGWASLVARLSLLREHFPELELPELQAELGAEGGRGLCEGRVSFAELRELDPALELEQALSTTAQRLLASETPKAFQLPGGRRAEIHYDPGKPPWLESRLQDFFGMRETPRICRGKLPLTLHLLAPNGRAQQVTSDLLGFWERHYPAVRRELMRKYPRHPWPEDARTATAPPYVPRPPRR